jgi:2'-5' RNA ligase
LRLFIAINLPHDVRSEIIAATSTLRDCTPELVWVTEARLHLTLKFLGDVDVERVSALQAALAGVAGRHRELLMTFGGISAFPNFRRARVVWLAVGNDPRLELLYHEIERAYDKLGIQVEGRTFRPHLTLARVQSVVPDDRLRLLARTAKRIDYRGECIVRTIDLMQSELLSAGPAYTTLVSAALRSD